MPRLLDIALVAALAVTPALAQPADDVCQSGAVSGTVEVGDGSKPPCGFVELWAVPESGNWMSVGTFPWGPATVNLPEGTWRLAAHGCETYVPFRPSDPVACRKNEKGCVRCDGRFLIKMFAVFGGFSGQVTMLPLGQAAGPGVPVSAAPALSCNSEKFTYTDPQGRFVLAPTIEPHRSNHWGLSVDGDGSGPGSRKYFLSAGACENGTTATTYSSVDVTVNLYRASPYMMLNDPSARPFHFPPLLPVAPPQEVGRGVSVTTGNVFIDQTDVAAWGGATALRFTRSYNSRAATAKVDSPLGLGWSHSYDAQVSIPEPRVVMLREDDGRVLYFQDSDGDGTYRASVPITERSRIVKAGMNLERRYPDGAHDVFAGGGRLVQRVDGTGRTTKLTRDPSGALTAIQDPDGRRLTLAYGAGGRLLKVSSGPDALVTYTYDAANRLQRATYADGSGFAFTYDDLAQLLSVADLGGRTLRTYTYTDGKARTFETAGGQDYIAIEYGPLKTTVVDRLGRTAIYEWTNVRGLHLVTGVSGYCAGCVPDSDPFAPRLDAPLAPLAYPQDAAGARTAADVAPPWPLVRWPLPPAVRWTSGVVGTSERQLWTYDLEGRLLSYSQPGGRAFYVAYDEQGDPSVLSDSQGTAVRFTRDASGRLTGVRAPSAVVADHERASLFAYDDKGRLVSRTETGLGADRLPFRLTTRLFYDESGRLAHVEPPRAGTDVTFAYDAAGNLTSVTDPIGLTRRLAGHNLLGYPATATEPGRLVNYTYDARGHVLSRAEGSDAVHYGYTATGRVREIVSPRGLARQYQYDGGDRLVEETSGEGRVVHRYDKAGQHVRDEILTGGGSVERQRILEYDVLGRLQVVFAPGGTRYEIRYDGGGRIESLKGPGTETSTVEYDDVARVTGLRVAGAGSFLYRYDSAARLLAATDGQGSNYLYSYDDLGRLQRAATPAGGTTAFDYDAIGNVVARTDGRGIVTSYDYDARGRLLHARFPKDRAIEYVYDDCPFGHGLLCSVTDGAGRSTFAYDGHARLSLETRDAAGARRQAGYSYDPDGNLAAIRYPSGQLVSYAWDEANHLRSVSTGGPRGGIRVLANFTAAIDGLLSGIAYANGTTVTYTRDSEGRVRHVRGGPLDLTYTYDAQGNVATQGAADGYQNFEYGPGRRLTVAGGPWGGMSWSYDGAGNRTAESTRTGNTSYAYQPRTQRLAATNGDRTVTFAYDGAGRTTRMGDSRFGYDEAGRLVSVATDERTVALGWDFKGRRAFQTSGQGTVAYQYDIGDRLLAEAAADGTWTDYIYAGDRPIAMVRSGLYAVLTDAAGTPRIVSDAQGQTAWERRPRPFGDETQPATSATSISLRAPGQYYDTETGIFYNGRRNYVPRIGRYLEPNPCAPPVALPFESVYGYAAQNPLSFVAPRGLDAQPAEGSWMSPPGLWAGVLHLPTVTIPGCESARDR